VGNDSTGWCNLANVAFRTGEKQDEGAVEGIELQQWSNLMGEMDDHLASYNLSRKHDDIRVSPMLELDSKTEQFVGAGSKNANQYLNREYRKGYEVPNLA
jgi:hypothetical protein